MSLFKQMLVFLALVKPNRCKLPLSFCYIESSSSRQQCLNKTCSLRAAARTLDNFVEDQQVIKMSQEIKLSEPGFSC